jgi:hypothetical protein
MLGETDLVKNIFSFEAANIVQKNMKAFPNKHLCYTSERTQKQLKPN